LPIAPRKENTGLHRCSLSLEDSCYAAFLRGTFAPDLRASLIPMAMACLRLFTLRLPPDFSLPCLYSRITLPTLVCAFLLYLRPLLELLADFAPVDFFLL